MSQATQNKKVKKVNGVDIYALHDTIKAVRTEPSSGASRFRLTNRWLGGSHNRSLVGTFTIGGHEHKHEKKLEFDNGEHQALLGEDESANPVEFVLHALAGCITTTTAYHAAGLGINIRKIETTLEGDLDLQGLLQTDPLVPPGYQNIRITMNIESDAEGEKLEQLKKLHAFSPVFDTIKRPVNIDVKVNA